MKELERLGRLAESVLRAALAPPAAPSAELRSSVNRLLKSLGEDRPLTLEQQRERRAVRVLKQAGTPAAHELLEALAKDSRWWTAQEAREALERLDRRGQKP